MVSTPTEPSRPATTSALWKYARDLEARVSELETWRATTGAVSAWRRWLLPTVLSVVAAATSVINVLSLAGRR